MTGRRIGKKVSHLETTKHLLGILVQVQTTGRSAHTSFVKNNKLYVHGGDSPLGFSLPDQDTALMGREVNSMFGHPWKRSTWKVIPHVPLY